MTSRAEETGAPPAPTLAEVQGAIQSFFDGEGTSVGRVFYQLSHPQLRQPLTTTDLTIGVQIGSYKVVMAKSAAQRRAEKKSKKAKKQG